MPTEHQQCTSGGAPPQLLPSAVTVKNDSTGCGLARIAPLWHSLGSGPVPFPWCLHLGCHVLETFQQVSTLEQVGDGLRLKSFFFPDSSLRGKLPNAQDLL
eukprot:3524839-Amphidinium_carterae.2